MSQNEREYYLDTAVYYHWKQITKKTHQNGISITDRFHNTSLNFCFAVHLKVYETLELNVETAYTFSEPIARQISFMASNWPLEYRTKPHDAIHSGFYLQSRTPFTVQCYKCSVRIKWRKEYVADLIHFEKQPSCPLLNKVSAINRILMPVINPRNKHIMDTCSTTDSLVQTLKMDGPVNINPHMESDNQNAPSVRALKSKKDIANRSKGTQVKQDDIIPKIGTQALHPCQLCVTENVSVVLLSCRHVVTCFACTLKIKDCPVCRTPIFASIDIYLT